MHLLKKYNCNFSETNNLLEFKQKEKKHKKEKKLVFKKFSVNMIKVKKY